jgi:fructokinase
MTTETRALALVFGECLVDWIDGVPIPGGAPFNVARHLAAFGMPVQMITRLGRDDHGDLLRRELQRFGVGTDLLQTDDGHPSGQVMVHHEPGRGHTFDILPDQAYDHIEWRAADVERVVAQARCRPWLVFGTLAQRSAANRSALASLRDRIPHQAFVDVNWREGHVGPQTAFQAVEQADIVKLSADELALMQGWRHIDDPRVAVAPEVGERREALAKLLIHARLSRLIVTYGADGYAQFNRDGVCECRGAAARLDRLADTVGAGDSFAAVTLLGAMLGWPHELALSRANQFAAAICQIRGAAPDDLGFYQPWKAHWFS